MAVIDFGKQEKKDRHLPKLANMFSTKFMQCVLLYYPNVSCFVFKSLKISGEKLVSMMNVG